MMIDASSADTADQSCLRRSCNTFHSWNRALRWIAIMSTIVTLCVLIFVNSWSASQSAAVEPWSSIYASSIRSTARPSDEFFQYTVDSQPATRPINTANSHTAVQDQDSFVDDQDTFVYDPRRDIIVFLHMQKTSGSVFGRNLVRNAVGFPTPCRRILGSKQLNCTSQSGLQWLFSRYANGWMCGLHADWTELHECVPSTLNRLENRKRRRRYVYITMLRNPVHRYLSEWKHVQRGATWKTSRLRCNGRSPAHRELPLCYTGDDWTGVNLQDFVSCHYNLANNRQTRMLANLSLVGCYNESAIPDSLERERLLLHSAMHNLRKMVFFGLTERQLDTQRLFERAFGVRFREDFVQRNNTTAQRTDVTENQLREIESANRLDMQLYQYAVELFDERVRRADIEDSKIGPS